MANLVGWCEKQGVKLHYIQSGKPTQNAYIERFNRTYRTEVLNALLFGSLSEVPEATHEWMTSYNHERPHDALGHLTPRQFRQQQTNPQNNNPAVKPLI